MASGFPDWLRAVQMLGKYGDVFTTVAVTEAGNLYVLLQGEDADEVLRTVRLDDEGRLSAFIIDSTDAWGRMLHIGNAELAARLGSPVLYEQSGRVQFIETFAQGIARWEQTIDGLGAGIATSPLYSMRDGYSAELIGGSTDPWLARIEHTQGGLPMGTAGLAFAYSTGTNFDNIIAEIALWDTARVHQLSMKLDSVNDKLKVLVPGPAWQEVGDANPHTNGREIFYFVKLTGDLETGYYKELRFNQEVIDISAHQFFNAAGITEAMIRVLIEVTSVNGDNDSIYVDDVILTSGEP